MRLDSTAFMYETFQRCRHAMPDAGSYVHALQPVLDAIHSQHSLIVEVTADIEKSVPALREYTLDESTARWPNGPLIRSAHAKLLPVLTATPFELTRLLANSSSEALRALGYALHVIPELLRAPEEFIPTQYAFSLGIVAKRWDDFSPTMRHSLVELVGREIAAAVLRKVGAKL